MTLVIDKFRALLPPRARAGASGWISFNAPCCHHRGHSVDKRKRAGVLFSDGITYNCFNCKFTATWKPGRQIGAKFRSLLKWMGASDTSIKEIVFEALKTEASDEQYEYKPIEFAIKELPENSILITPDIEINEYTAQAITYLYDRGINIDEYQFFWSSDQGYRERIIIPFYYEGKLVGYTARKITNGKPKYLSDQSANFVFNLDMQYPKQRYAFVVEGPFDAMSINGLAVLTNRISQEQAQLIKNVADEIIVIPDQDEAGLEMIDSAVEHGFGVAFPTWSEDIKDVNDAVLKYGHLFVTVDAISTSHQSKIKIAMHKKKLEQRLKQNEENN